MDIKLDKIKEILGEAFYENYIAPFINSYLESDKLGLDIYLINKELGLDFILNDYNVLTTLIFYNNTEGYNKFNKALPFEISFNMNQQDIRREFGNPYKVNNGITTLDITASDIYLKKGFRFLVSYSNDFKSILQVQFTIEQFND
ncbi:hypothetical protein [Olleya sp. R77988]|uniref:hypothetical protein n=1 Tax=Olleya sp. R77988 TaxID=3093875 RepID=UPI0037C6961D